MPSLPVFGTESPPVATITASASSGGAPSRLDPPAAVARARARDQRIQQEPRAPPRREREQPVAHVARAVRRRERASPTPAPRRAAAPARSRRTRSARRSGHERSILRSGLGDESVTKRDSSTRVGRMLQRPPPLMRIFRPPSRVRSRSTVSAPAPAAKIAAIEPAAPAPMTTTRRRGIGAMYYSPTPMPRPTHACCPLRRSAGRLSSSPRAW